MIEKLVKQAGKKADSAELYHERSRSSLFKSVLDRVESCDNYLGEGWSLRVVKNGRVGFAYFTSPNDFAGALKSALRSAKFAKKTGLEFALRDRYPQVRGLYDRNVRSLDEEKLLESLLASVDSVKDTRSSPIQSFLSRSVDFSEGANTNGCSWRSEETYFDASCIAQYRESRAYEHAMSHSTFDASAVAQRAGFLARRGAGAKPVRGEFDIVLDPRVVTDLLGEVLLPAINGERVFRKQSSFTGKLGRQVMREGISLYDDPLISGGNFSCGSDDEGVRSRTKSLVSKGVLNTFLYNIEAAALAGAKSTGNGFRPSFTGMPGTVPTNIRLEAKDRERMDELSGVVLYDLMAVHNVNPVTGDFSVEIAAGFTLENGELKKPIRGCAIVGNFFDVMKSLRPCDDTQVREWYYGPSLVYRGKIV